MKKLVFICSPFSGTEEEMRENVEIAKRLCRKAIAQGLVPFAPHLIYPGFLSEDSAFERELGISCGIEVLDRCDLIWVYDGPKGVTKGMSREINRANMIYLKIQYVKLDDHDGTCDIEKAIKDYEIEKRNRELLKPLAPFIGCDHYAANPTPQQIEAGVVDCYRPENSSGSCRADYCPFGYLRSY